MLDREFHEYIYADGQLQRAEVSYRLPNGELIGKKSIDYTRSLHVPTFLTELYEGRFVEGLRYEGDKAVMFRRKGEKGKEKSKTIQTQSAMVADAGFNNYVTSKFAELMRGETVSFKFVAPTQLAAIQFDARKIGDRTLDTGMPVTDFKVEISSFLSWFVDPLTLSYDPETQNLIEYRGVSNVRDADGELYKVRIRYPQLIRTSDEIAQTKP